MIVSTVAQDPGTYSYDELRTITFHDIQMPASYTNGNLAEAHILRVIVDSENWIYEHDELNNEATRAVIIGGAPDAQIFSMAYNGAAISALIKNTGTSPVVSGVLRLYYLDIYGAEYEITGSQGISIGSMPVNGQVTRTFAWNAPETAELIIGRISSVSPTEYNELNNEKIYTTGQACPDLSASAPPVRVTDSECGSGCTTTGGSIDVPAEPCPTGSSFQYAVSTDGGISYGSWTDIVPGYNQNGPAQMIKTRCRCEADTTLASPGSAVVTTSPGTCTELQPEILVAENSGIAADDAQVCQGAAVTLTVAGSFQQQVWNDGSESSSITVYPQADSYYYVVVADQNGCTGTRSVLISVNEINPVIIGPSTVCPGSSAMLTAAGGTSYEWSTSDLNASITISPSQATTYTVTVTDAGCSATSTKLVQMGSDIFPEAYCRSAVAVSLDASGVASITGSDLDFGSFDYLMSCSYSAQYWDIVMPGNAQVDIMAPDITLQSPDDMGESFGSAAKACIENPEQATILLDWGYSTVDVATYYDPFGYSLNGIFVQLTEDQGALNQYGSTAVQVEAGQVFCLEQRTLDAYTGAARTICTLKRAISLASFPNSFNCQNLGSNIVTLVVTDESGNTGTCTSTVYVSDTRQPEVSDCPAGLVFSTEPGQCGTTASYDVPYVTDNCQSQMALVQGLASGSFFPAGTTQVVYELIENGITRASCSFQIEVVDQSAPVASCRDISVAVSGGFAAVYPEDINVASIDNCTPETLLELSFDVPGPGIFSCADIGEHILMLTVTDAAGNTGTCTSRVVVNAVVPVASISAGQSEPCGGSVTLTAGGGQTYHWSTGATSASVEVLPAVTTLYTVTVTSESGCTDTGELEINPAESFIAGVDGVDAICRSTSTTLTAFGGNQYLWSTGATTAGITVSPVFSTFYTVTVTGASGCSAVLTKILVVNSLPEPLIHGGLVICAGQTATLSASGGTSYLWSTQETGASITVSPLVTTSYAVTATDQNGCSARKTRELLVNPLPDIQISGPDTVCAGSYATLTVTGAQNWLVQWNNGSSGTPVELLSQATADYIVTVTTSAGCTSTASHTVHAATPPQIAVVPSGVLCNGGSIDLSATGGGNIYSWSTGETTESVRVDYSGTYTVTVSSAGGCTGSALYTVESLSAPYLASVSPASGNPGTPVLITGSNFTPNSMVWFNGAPASGTSYISSAYIQAMLFDEGQIQFVSVSNECGTGLLELAYTPHIISFEPESGPAGTVVEIKGIGLGTLSALTIGGVQAIILSSSPNMAKAYVMPGSGTGHIVAFTNYGNVSSSGVFTVLPTPFPYVQEGGKLTGTGALGNARQGASVAVSSNGNVAVVGGPSDNGGKGAAWIYTRENGVWTQRVQLIPPDAIGRAGHGISVALSADGRTAAVGGSGDNLNAGAVWVYTPANSSGSIMNTGDWAYLAPVVKLTGSGGVGSAVQLGATVAISADGKKIVAGAPGDNTGVGAIWTFRKVNGIWQQRGQKLTASNAEGRSRQGAAVALSPDGNILLAGGTHDNQRKGATWIYQENGNGWSQTDKLVGSGGSSDNSQGCALAISADGNTVLTGGSSDNSLKGAVWVFKRGASGGWTQLGEKLTGSQMSGATRFGSSVGLSADGKSAVIGGHGDSGGRGAMWVYQEISGQWLQQGNKVAGTGAAGRVIRQGISIALCATGGTALLGGSGDAANKGAAWVFVPGAAARKSAERAESEQNCNNTGMSLQQNVPNPLSGQTTIGFSLPEACDGEWIVSDVNGWVVLSFSREYPAGENSELFDMSQYSGVYWYTLKTRFGTLTRRMVVAR